MEMYKKPVMKIIELENVDVLTASGKCDHCDYFGSGLNNHIATVHPETLTPPDEESQG